MLGYIIAIIALLVVIPVVFFLVRGGPKPSPTAAEEEEGSGTIRQEPAQEQVSSVDEETDPSRPSKPE